MYKIEDDPLSAHNMDGFSSPYYKHLLDEADRRDAAYRDAVSKPDYEDAEFEEVKEDVKEPLPSKEDDPFKDEESDAKKLLTHGTSKGLTAVDKLLDTSRFKSNQMDVEATFKSLFQDLNTTYGLDIKFDFNSFTNTLNYIIKPKNKAALELYVSEAYGRVRAALYCMYLNAIVTLSQQILNPKFMESNSMAYTDKLVLMRELFQYIQSLNEIYEKVNIKDSDIQLRKLADSSNEEDDFNSAEVQDFLTALTNSIKK